jgi:hypothetical protein
MFSGAPHKLDTQRATPNHLEASFKSSKYETTNQKFVTSAFLNEQNMNSLKASISHLKCHSHSNPR